MNHSEFSRISRHRHPSGLESSSRENEISRPEKPRRDFGKGCLEPSKADVRAGQPNSRAEGLTLHERSQELEMNSLEPAVHPGRGWSSENLHVIAGDVTHIPVGEW